MEATRVTVRNLILGFTGVLISLLIIRLFLLVLGANSSQFLIQILYGFTELFVSPFTGIIPSVDIVASMAVSTFVAIVAYIVFALILSDFITSFIDDDILQILGNLFDSCLKILEFLLVARITMKFFAIASGGWFIDTVYNSTNWVKGILPSFSVGRGEVELSAVVAFVIVVVLDVTLESLLRGYRKSAETSKATKVVVKSSPPPPTTAQPNNITINLTPNPIDSQSS